MPVDENYLKFAIWTAGANWIAWHRDFEAAGGPQELPVLLQKERFILFLNEYKPLRGVTKQLALELGNWLVAFGAFQQILTHPDGSSVE